VPPKTTEQETAKEENESVELESQIQKDGVADSAVLSSMPCLLMELRRDSSESHDKPTTGRVYESDSSNHCMLCPSFSDHLADSDTLSSAEENEPSQAETAVEGDPSGVSGATVGRKSRRSRSESETSTMAAKKNWQSKWVKGHQSQKHKERIRLLRHKREVAASSTTCCRTVSSTSDSDLTYDDEEVSGSSKTITAEIPDGPPVVAHYDMPDTSSDPEVVTVYNLSAAAVVQKHNNSIGGQDTGATWRTSRLLEELNAEAGHLHPGFLASDKISAGNAPLNEEINIASSDSEVEIVGVQEHARCVHPRGGVIRSASSWKHGSGTQYLSTRQTHPHQTWASPAEVIDLISDEDSRHKYLL
uniref:E3 ubiquitin-protein ligase Arkadia N-terminal domain-containing protein n=1 Tax=Gorilla gorilla gorilla TaxID=9595 RepID=A0A2I2Y5N2_GORGO